MQCSARQVVPEYGGQCSEAPLQGAKGALYLALPAHHSAPACPCLPVASALQPGCTTPVWCCQLALAAAVAAQLAAAWAVVAVLLGLLLLLL